MRRCLMPASKVYLICEYLFSVDEAIITEFTRFKFLKCTVGYVELSRTNFSLSSLINTHCTPIFDKISKYRRAADPDPKIPTIRSN